jgi:hypothetical protein
MRDIRITFGRIVTTLPARRTQLLRAPSARCAVDGSLRQLTAVDVGLRAQAKWKNEPTDGGRRIIRTSRLGRVPVTRCYRMLPRVTDCNAALRRRAILQNEPTARSRRRIVRAGLRLHATRRRECAGRAGRAAALQLAARRRYSPRG